MNSLVQASEGETPTAGDPVRLATGDAIEQPDADLEVYNPVGPSVRFARYFDNRLAQQGFQLPGMPVGWTHNYGMYIEGPELPGTWGTLNLRTLNGAYKGLAPQLDSAGDPTGAFTVASGSQYIVNGDPSDVTGQWNSITITYKDGTNYTFSLTSVIEERYRLTRVTDRMGHCINLLWDTTNAEHLLNITRGGSTQTELLALHYSSSGMIESITDCYGRKVVYSCAIPSGLTDYCLMSVSQVCAIGEQNPPMNASYTYCAYSNRPVLQSTSHPSPTGTGISTWHFSYDTQGRVNSQLSPNGNTHTYTYNAGNTNEAVYNTQNQIVLSQKYYFNENGNDLGVEDTDGHRTTIEYADTQNPFLPTKRMYKDGKYESFTYDTYGNLLSYTDKRGIATEFSYDDTDFALGRLTQLQRGEQTPTVITYNEPTGLITEICGPRPGSTSSTVSTTYTYDELGNLLTEITPGNETDDTIVTTYNYTADGSYTQTAALGQPLTMTDNLAARG